MAIGINELMQSAKNSTKTTGGASASPASASGGNGGFVTPVAASSVMYRGYSGQTTMTPAQKTIVQGLLKQNPQLVTTAYDRLTSSYENAYKATQGDLVSGQQISDARNAVRELGNSIKTLQGIQEALGIRASASQTNAVQTALGGYEDMRRNVDTQYAKWRLSRGPQVENPTMEAQKSRVGNMALSAYNSFAAGLAGNVLTTADKIAADDAASRNLADEQRIDYYEQRKQQYLDDVALGMPEDPELFAWYDEQIEKARAQQQPREERYQRFRETIAPWRAGAQELMTASEEQRTAAKKGLGTIGQYMVDVGITSGQMLLDRAASGFGAVDTKVPMALRVFGNGALEAERNGGNVNEQIYQGTKQAAIEWITETLFAGNPVYDQGGGVVTDLVYDGLYKVLGEETVERALSSAAAKIAKVPMEMAAEGIEEVLSDIFNPLADRLANAIDGGDREVSMPGAAALRDDFIVGALAGGIGNVTTAGSNAARDAVMTRQGGRTIQANDAQEALERTAGYVGEDISTEGKNARQLGQAFRQVQQAYLDRAVENRLAGMGVETSPEMIEAVTRMAEDKALTREQQRAYFGAFNQTRQVMQEYQRAMSGDVDANNFWAYDAIIRPEDLQSGTRETETQEPAEAGTQGQEEEGAAEEPTPARADETVLQRERAAMAEALRTQNDAELWQTFGAKTVQMYGAMQEAASARRFEEANAYEQLIDEMQNIAAQVNSAPNTEQPQALRVAMENVYGGMTNGTEGSVLLDGDGRRDAGEGPGIKAGAVRSVDTGNVRRGETHSRSDRAIPAADTSARELGIRNGTEAVRNSIVQPEAWSDEMRTAADEAARRGMNVTYVRGALEIMNPVTGRVQRANGHVDGNAVVVQADNRAYRPEKILDHEVMHERIAADPALMDDALERMDLSDEQIERIAVQYARMYNFVYGEVTESMTADEVQALMRMYLEEFVCDAAAGLDRVSARGTVTPSRYRDTVRNVISEREGMGYGAGGMPGSRYMFAGPNAATADRQALTSAEEMERQGADSEEIRKATKWFRGMDGEWRFEFSDADANYHRHGDAQARRDHPAFATYQGLMEKLLYGTLTEDEESELRRLDSIWGSELSRLSEIVDSGGARLDMVLDHPALYEAYPQLRGVRVRFGELNEGTRGSYNPRNKTISLREDLKNNEVDVMRTLLHEIQHAVQSIEGFASGANPSYWGREGMRRYDEAVGFEEAVGRELSAFIDGDEYLRELDRRYERGEIDIEEYDRLSQEYLEVSAEYKTLEKQYQDAGRERRFWERKVPSELYEATAGEIEARDAAARRRMTDEERKNTRPDIDRADVVFAEDAGKSYEIGVTEDGRSFVNVEEDILYGLPKKKWRKTVRDELQVRFGNGIQMPSDLIKVNYDARKEFTSSKDSRFLNRNDIQRFADKMRLAINIDEIMRAADNWVGEEPTHPHKKIREFARGDILVRVGGNDYTADVLVGTMNDGSLMFYDVVNLTPTTIKERAERGMVSSEDRINHSLALGSNNSISDSAGKGNTEFEGLRSNLPGFTRWDREAEARAEREARYSAEDAGEIGETAYDEQETARLTANIEAMTPTELRRAIAQDRAEIETLERYESKGYLNGELRQRLAELKQQLPQEQARLKEIDQRVREERTSAQKRAAARQRPTQAREDFIRDTLDHFSVKQGRNEIGEILGRFFDDARSRGSVDERDKETLFRKMVDAGLVSAAADPSYHSIYDAMRQTKIYVPEDVRSDFGDNYEELRRRAFGAGIILTSDQNAQQIDVLNAEMAKMFPGSFRASDTDRGAMLENIIETARQGMDEQVSLPEMMQRVENTEGWSVDAQMDNMMDWLENRIDKALYAAGIEVRQKAKNALAQAREREQRKDMLKRQAEQRELREMQHKTMNALRWLKKNRTRTDAEARARWDEVLGDINLYTMSAANEMAWSDKHQATYGELRDMYQQAQKNDPNWMPSKELDALMSKLDGQAIADMDVDALDTLYKAAVALRTEFYNRNNVINDEEHRLFSEVYQGAAEEIRASDGKGTLGKGIGKLTDAEMLTPMQQLERMGGWTPNGQWRSMARQLQSGERAKKKYIAESRSMLDAFTEEHKEWLRKADGQGKDAVWYEIEVPELMELHMGDKPIFGETKTVYMTPLQKVQMYLESKNYQNLQHMTGGRTFVDKDLYSKGKSREALAQGTTVRLAPETVKSLVSDLTAEEMELANLLERYYNGYARDEINRVSNILYGYDKAMTEYYTPIFTDSNYNKSTAGLFDVTAEGVGHMKSREQVSKNPSYNLSAIDAFQRHTEQTSRFVGLAIPVRNVETLLNWYGSGTTMKKILSEKWGGEGVNYVEDLLTELQSPTIPERSAIQELGDKAVSNYISAVFAANPGIVFKQAASYPAAAAVLGFENIPRPGQLANVDESLIEIYTPELAYRKLGYGTAETANMTKNPNVLDRNKVTRFLFRGGAITAMDAATVRSLWPWAENYVKRNFPELEVGDQATIESGNSPYYKKVADMFNEAVTLTQPMYDVMNRARIMNSKDALTRTFTLFKTVPLQEYNTLRKYLGEAKHGGKEAKKAVAGAIGSILVSTLMLEGIEAMNAWVKNGLKYYRDDDDELTAESFAREFAMNIAGDLAGIMVGGSEIFEWITNKMGLGGYSSEFTIVGTEQINEIKEVLDNGAERLENVIGGMLSVQQNGGDVAAYLRRNAGDLRGGVKELATAIAKYCGGLPVENIEKYLSGILGKASPELSAQMQGWFDTTTKTDLTRVPERELPPRIGSLLEIRNIDADEGTSEELARLYTAGFKKAVPSDTPDEIGDRDMSAYEMQVYDNAYSKLIGDGLDALVESDAYIEADDAGRADMLKMLYDYAGQNALREVDPDHTFSSTYAWVQKANEAAESGIDAVTYIEARQTMKTVDAANDANGTITQAEAEEALRGMDLTNDQRAVLWQLTNTAWKADNNPFSGGESKIASGRSVVGTADMSMMPVNAGTPRKDPTDTAYLNTLYKDLTPPEGMSTVTKTQKYRAIVDAFDSVDDQITALSTIMSDSEMQKIQVGNSRGVTPGMYVSSKEEMYEIDDDGNVSQIEAKYALDGMDLTNDQKAVLWQLTNKSWKPYINPYDTDIGVEVYDEMHS